MVEVKKTVLSPDSPLHNMYQTSDHWRKVSYHILAAV
jgi:hypothetical protein